MTVIVAKGLKGPGSFEIQIVVWWPRGGWLENFPWRLLTGVYKDECTLDVYLAYTRRYATMSGVWEIVLPGEDQSWANDVSWRSFSGQTFLFVSPGRPGRLIFFCGKRLIQFYLSTSRNGPFSLYLSLLLLQCNCTITRCRFSFPVRVWKLRKRNSFYSSTVVRSSPAPAARSLQTSESSVGF